MLQHPIVQRGKVIAGWTFFALCVLYFLYLGVGSVNAGRGVEGWAILELTVIAAGQLVVIHAVVPRRIQRAEASYDELAGAVKDAVSESLPR